MWHMQWTLHGLCLCELCIWTLYVTFLYTLNEAFFFRMKISMQATLQILMNDLMQFVQVLFFFWNFCDKNVSRIQSKIFWNLKI